MVALVCGMAASACSVAALFIRCDLITAQLRSAWLLVRVATRLSIWMQTRFMEVDEGRWGRSDE
jgi:hypothetical protein